MARLRWGQSSRADGLSVLDKAVVLRGGPCRALWAASGRPTHWQAADWAEGALASHCARGTMNAQISEYHNRLNQRLTHSLTHSLTSHSLTHSLTLQSSVYTLTNSETPEAHPIFAINMYSVSALTAPDKHASKHADASMPSHLGAAYLSTRKL